MALSHASDSAKDHKKIVLAAVKQCPDALQYASAPLRNNLDIAAAAVQKNGLALQFTLENPRLDREIVMSAVSSGGQGALEFAPLFKNDYLIQNIARMYIPGEQDRSSFA